MPSRENYIASYSDGRKHKATKKAVSAFVFSGLSKRHVDPAVEFDASIYSICGDESAMKRHFETIEFEVHDRLQSDDSRLKEYVKDVTCSSFYITCKVPPQFAEYIKTHPVVITGEDLYDFCYQCEQEMINESEIAYSSIINATSVQQIFWSLMAFLILEKNDRFETSLNLEFAVGCLSGCLGSYKENDYRDVWFAGCIEDLESLAGQKYEDLPPFFEDEECILDVLRSCIRIDTEGTEECSSMAIV